MNSLKKNYTLYYSVVISGSYSVSDIIEVVNKLISLKAPQKVQKFIFPRDWGYFLLINISRLLPYVNQEALIEIIKEKISK